MSARKQAVAVLKEKETRALFESFRRQSGACFPVMRDLLNGVFKVPQHEEALTLLCEFVSANRMVSMSLEHIFKKENMKKQGQYEVDYFQFDTLRTSFSLLSSIKRELSSMNISLDKH